MENYDFGYNAFYNSVPYDPTKPREWQNGWLDAETEFTGPDCYDYDSGYEEDMDYGE